MALHLGKVLAYAQDSTRAETKRLRFYVGASLATHSSVVALQIQLLAKLGYAHPRELLMDVLRYGVDAEVIAPPELREQMRGMLAGALGKYG